MPRPQFTIKSLFWLTLCVAMFFGGMAAQYHLAGIQATEREKKRDAVIALMRKQLQLHLQQLRTYDDKQLELLLELEKARTATPHRDIKVRE